MKQKQPNNLENDSDEKAESNLLLYESPRHIQTANNTSPGHRLKSPFIFQALIFQKIKLCHKPVNFFVKKTSTRSCFQLKVKLPT